MKFNVFTGKLGKEKFLMEVDATDITIPIFPTKGDLVYLPLENQDTDNVYDGETYVVNQILTDYVHDEYNVFVDIYNWED